MAGIFGYGTIFSATVSNVLTPIAELLDIAGLELEADDVDLTTHSSANGYRQYVQGLKDGGEVSLEGNFASDSSQVALKTLFDSGTTVAMTIAFPNGGGVWSFNGYVKGISTDAPHDDKIEFTATIKVTGQPTLTSSSNVYSAVLTIQDELAAAVEGAIVYLNDKTVETLADGVATFTNLTNGTYGCLIAKDGYVTQTASEVVNNANVLDTITLVAVSN